MGTTNTCWEWAEGPLLFYHIYGGKEESIIVQHFSLGARRFLILSCSFGVEPNKRKDGVRCTISKRRARTVYSWSGCKITAGAVKGVYDTEVWKSCTEECTIWLGPREYLLESWVEI